jgi:DNA-binding response OmpR family regulator
MSRVLIIEDEQHLAQGLQFNLEAEGYDVEIAADGETALSFSCLRRMGRHSTP